MTTPNTGLTRQFRCPRRRRQPPTPREPRGAPLTRVREERSPSLTPRCNNERTKHDASRVSFYLVSPSSSPPIHPPPLLKKIKTKPKTSPSSFFRGEKKKKTNNKTPTNKTKHKTTTAKLGEVLETPAKDYHESARRLSGLIKTGLLKFTDLKNHPSKFFEAHRLLVNHGFEQGPGFSIRFTVQFNLFAGTVLELGGPHHLAGLGAEHSHYRHNHEAS